MFGWITKPITTAIKGVADYYKDKSLTERELIACDKINIEGIIELRKLAFTSPSASWLQRNTRPLIALTAMALLVVDAFNILTLPPNTNYICVSVITAYIGGRTFEKKWLIGSNNKLKEK